MHTQGTTSIFIFGLGYSASHLAHQLMAREWEVHGTTRDLGGETVMNTGNLFVHQWAGGEPSPGMIAALKGATHALISLPPGEADVAARTLVAEYMSDLVWSGYLSATSVYGDHGGAWVDEDTPVSPIDGRGQKRLEAEQEWQKVWSEKGHIFRLSGIYGPGRSVVERLRAGHARRIVKEGHYFSRIHVADIAETLSASMSSPAPGNTYNLADNLPTPSHELIDYACELMGATPPETEPFESADMSDMMRSFYSANRRIKNDKIKALISGELRFPTYKEGLEAIWHEVCMNSVR